MAYLALAPFVVILGALLRGLHREGLENVRRLR